MEELTNLFDALSKNRYSLTRCPISVLRCSLTQSSYSQQSYTQGHCSQVNLAFPEAVDSVNAQQSFDIEVTSSLDDLEQYLLLAGDEIFVPVADHNTSIFTPISNRAVPFSVRWWHRVILVLIAVVEHLM